MRLSKKQGFENITSFKPQKRKRVLWKEAEKFFLKKEKKLKKVSWQTNCKSALYAVFHFHVKGAKKKRLTKKSSLKFTKYDCANRQLAAMRNWQQKQNFE